MKIIGLKTNHRVNPLGFAMDKPSFTYQVVDTAAAKQTAAQVQVASDEAFEQILFDSGKTASIDSLAYSPDMKLEPCTRYYWRVTVWAENGEYATSEPAWFETAKAPGSWSAKWIAHTMEQGPAAWFTRGVAAKKAVARARAYMVGLGIYELYINGEKIGDEYLAPGLHAYDKWIQYQTYDVTKAFQAGENQIEVWVGDGWYRGRYGFQGKEQIYGNETALIAEFVLEYADGSRETIVTDESWQAKKSKVTFANIYDGECYDDRIEDGTLYPVRAAGLGYDRLEARLSPPIVANERITPVAVLNTPAGETVLDMGQNMVGLLEIKLDEPAGTEVFLQFGEILQHDNFYRDNLRSALEEYHFISSGKPVTIRQHFTFYGFRFVKVSGMTKPVEKENFTGVVLHSEMERRGWIETSDPLINRLFLNAIWGQKGNFVDVPTDCPQRDERMGWTGDAQAFSGTATFNMDTYAFYSKYGRDLAYEQGELEGAVPHVVPMGGMIQGGSTAWGEAATVIPWNCYLHYGDKEILESQFKSMKDWVDFIKRQDEAAGGKRLWTTGFHFGDWLALDNYKDPKSCFGATDNYFIASAYYCYSAMLVAKAAKVLGKEELAKEYSELSDQVRAAIQREYVTPNGRLSIETQTAHVMALFMNLVPQEQRPRVIADLRELLKKNDWKLTTGFVGTIYLCRVLSENGCNDVAYRLLMNRDYPSWIYEVLMGATTVWERWNSVLPNGLISDTGMNSLNHYAYGSVVEWMYRNVAGIQPVEDEPGFRCVRLAPQPNARLDWVKTKLDSAAGVYVSEWKIEHGKLSFRFEVPFNAEAEILLPDARLEKVLYNGQPLSASTFWTEQQGDCVNVKVLTGVYEFAYEPEKLYARTFSIYSATKDVIANPEARKAVESVLPNLMDLRDNTNQRLPLESSELSLRDQIGNPFVGVTPELLDKIEELLNQIPCEK
ncbi:Bacterial alpha-L-rhamnosidase [uncultured Ruminococcus sp.]|uniref:alpha-L-rhamnosidase n=1 Tax=Hydrogeniiclostridium mannosilyticum TaxID=2764322 RepID=A0A328UJS1_9FIRM|nr:alpha-L-rhamnosidase [Hydrogeniiclostridium mannosilyticum]MBS6163796.1 family 78 glycoside hydrolase catalytic domain [Clostridiales bacterium]RAQ29783.1 alfa-L-rhamnosidase RamA [Hydrogeniiclostridium mannosilyticum]SCI28219.1 Bacterial alpha-L-rhamnosidase [uncultured Ruminococcus sp.]